MLSFPFQGSGSGTKIVLFLDSIMEISHVFEQVEHVSHE